MHGGKDVIICLTMDEFEVVIFYGWGEVSLFFVFVLFIYKFHWC